MPTQPMTSDHPLSTGMLASMEAAGDIIPDNDEPEEGRWSGIQLVPLEGSMDDAGWVARGKTRVHSWQAALVGTLGLMALVIVTATGAPRLLSNQQNTPLTRATPTSVVATAPKQEAIRTVQAVAATPTNKAGLLGVQPTATHRVEMAASTATGTATPTALPPTPTFTPELSTATATVTVTVTSTSLPTQIPPTVTPKVVVPAVAPLPPARVVTYIVRPGDTLSGIAQRYGRSMDALARANRLGVGMVIYVGQVLVIP